MPSNVCVYCIHVNAWALIRDVWCNSDIECLYLGYMEKTLQHFKSIRQRQPVSTEECNRQAKCVSIC